MARGTWQGSGTWQTSGPDLAGVIVPAVVVGAAAAVMIVVLEFIWYIAVFLATVTAGLIVGAVAVRRKNRAHAAMLAATRTARLEALTGKPQVAAGARPAIENHYHVHHHYAAGPEPVRVVRVIPGDAGEILTEGESS